MTQIYFCVRFILPARLKLEAPEQKTFWYLCTINQTMFMTQLHTYVYTFACIWNINVTSSAFRIYLKG